MQTITKQWICKQAEMELLFLERLAINWANSACIAVQNLAFRVLNKASNKVVTKCGGSEKEKREMLRKCCLLEMS